LERIPDQQFDLESIHDNSLNDIQNEKATRQLGGLFFKGE